MSWVFGIVGETSILEKTNLKFPKEIKFKYRNSNVLIYSDGIDETTICKTTSDKSGFIVLGLGIKSISDKFGFINENEWQKITTSDNVDNLKLNGHYVVLKYDNSSIKIFNDRLGVRDLFLYKTESSIIFSTRLDWVTKFQSDSKIDLREFGSLWLTANQIMHGSLIKNIQRLGPGANAEIDISILTIKIKNKIWEPDWNKSITNDDLISCIEELILSPSKQEAKTTLGLSGGLDSRTLLAMFLKNNTKSFRTHIFGFEGNNDVAMAKRITDKLNIDFDIIPSDLNNAEEIIEAAYKFIPYSWFAIPLRDLFVMPIHHKLYNDNKVIIDGAYGEIVRREFLNRVLFMGKDAVTYKNAKKFYKFIKLNHGDFFQDEVNSIFLESTFEKINLAFQSMPDYKRISLENWLDYFSMIYKLPNLGALGQTCADQVSVAYMPFVQPDLVERGLQVPVRLRKNSKINREVIRQYDKRLEKFPLIKNLISYPYHTATLSMRAITGIKRKFSNKENNEYAIEIIECLKEFIFDRISSSEVKNYDLYNYKKIKSVAESYFSGNKNYKHELESWLLFDIWREIILQKN